MFLLCFGVISESTLSLARNSESYRYEVVYQLGFIWKKAAEATLTLSENEGGNQAIYRAKLTAKTVPFADKIFRVRDTLVSDMKENYQPLFYAKITNEDNVYRRDEIMYFYHPDKTVGETTLLRPHRNAIDYATLEANSQPAMDMLSLFFYLRTLDFSNAQMRQRFEVRIFSGKRSELLTIEYLGRTLYTRPDKKQQGAYRLALSFTLEKEGKETDKITVLVSDDEYCYPLYMEGKLPMGSLKARYIGQ